MSFLKQLLTDWPNPPAIYRGAPFWSWNAEMQPDRLVRAVEEMAAVGMGGFFIHSREGLHTPYMGEQWFACVNACVERARELGVKAYLYDEDRWPSGAGGGFATREHMEFRTHGLLAAETGEHRAEALASFAVETDPDGRVTQYRALHGEDADGRVITFYDCVGSDNNWFNRGAYIDTMSPDAVDEFIHVAYQAYADHVGKDFGGVIPAIFTDEPNLNATRDYVWQPDDPISYLPWTPEMPMEFIRRRGYDLREHLPELIYPLADGEFSKVRHDYYQTATELFVECFMMRIGQWCRKHNIALTGHVLQEESLLTQNRAVGSTMPHYEHMDWPGIDVLFDQAWSLSAARQVASVAAQLGKQRVLSEMYGCTGWDWPLEGHKFVGDWQYACGVNFRCHHLTHYSLAGSAKRDYPASIFVHSPWWKYYRVVEDYFGRLSAALTPGQPVRDVLVIHPMQSAWGLCRHTDVSPLLQEIDDARDRLINILTGEHYDFDFGDESLLASHAKVTKDELAVGQMSYRAVVVPPCITLRASTVELLDKFIAAGGDVLFVGQIPNRLDAEPSDAPAALANKARHVETVDALPAAMESVLPRRVSVRTGDVEERNVWAMLKSVSGGQMLFIQSHDREQGMTARVSVEGAAPVTLWDMQTGRRFAIPAESKDSRVEFTLKLESSGSALLSLGLAVTDAEPLPAEPQVAESYALDGPYEIELTEPNTLPLDYCQFAIGESDFSEAMDSLAAEAKIREHFQLPARFGYVCQPWYLYGEGLIDSAPRGRCRLRRTFRVEQLPSRCLLAIERPEDFAVTVNGRPVGEPDGWWVDEDIRTIDITALLREGENEVVQDFDYRANMELEALYLVGNFGVAPAADASRTVNSADADVRQPRPPYLKGDVAAHRPGELTITAPPTQLACGPWIGQGLDFYGAAVRYRLTVSRPADGRVRLTLPGVACTAAVIHAGGQQFVLPWAPFAADITEALSPGENEVTLEVIGGRRNILGPLHTPWGIATGPGAFEPFGPEWTDDYLLTEHGLTEPPVVEILAN